MPQGKIRVVHVADTHIDPTARYLGPKEQERRRDFIKAFELVVSKTLEIKPDLMVISGDLFDKVNPRNPARVRVMKALRRLHSEGVKIYAIGGNHDTPRSIEEGASPLHELEAAGYLRFFSKTRDMEADTVTIGDLRVCVSGASYNHMLPLDEDPLETMRVPLEGDVNIAMLHYNFSPVKASYVWRAPTIKETSVPRGLHYLALGHYHGFYKARAGEAMVVYPGSTERRTFAEENEEKGFVYAELDERGISSINHIKTSPRPLKTLEVVVGKGTENPVGIIVSRAREHADKETILRLRVKGRLSQEQLNRYNRDEILRQLEKIFFHVIVEDRELEYVVEQPTLSGIDTLSPLRLYENYLLEAISKAASEDKKGMLREALELGMKLLEKAGAW